ncbi:hypothetical protein K437DRAFT_227229 [Tilletiaria anomala UBC 951]|uniref:HD/PDEase domain-containing protein n=1 Tax=Tilletiaria anomala (strain ATCC 24038 / CBS 436.72 / UBC 951) TaxID=1037660 RepID=A0A066VQ15_TILAU|nr:uncharacterized protein K437DRAFT_227229 [Tilletiaria anomala UBC 951]KDN40690.1 hypothetical protein K437DRAFT_227229 [Tilletiaria anomala UBC 951]
MALNRNTSSSNPFLPEDHAARQAALIEGAEGFVTEHFKNHDPSHDWQHVNRVRMMALSLSRCSSLKRQPDMLVLELAALFHDLCDSKYIPLNADGIRSKAVSSSKTVIAPFLSQYSDAITPDQAAHVFRVVDNVSWSKDQAKRRARAQAQRDGQAPSTIEQEQIEWEQENVELHCVSDADRLDAIGSFGILRCAAFSAVKNRTLHVPPKNKEGTSAPPFEQSAGYSDTAIAHFYDKLVKIKGEMLFTETARKEAERRQQMLQSFLTELDIEWLVAEQGAQLSLLEA